MRGILTGMFLLGATLAAASAAFLGGILLVACGVGGAIALAAKVVQVVF